MAAREQPIIKGGARGADMHQAGGGWREAGYDGHDRGLVGGYFRLVNAVASYKTFFMQGKVKLFEELIAAQAGRLLLWLPVMMMGGSALYFALRQEPAVWWGLGALALVMGAVAALWSRRMDGAGWRLGWAAGILSLWVVIGFGLAQARTAMLATPILEEKIRVAHITGTVTAVEMLGAGDGQRIILRDPEIEGLAPEKTPKRIRLKIRQADDFPIGARVRVMGALNPPSAPVWPGSYDFQRHAYFKGIGAYGFAFRMPEIVAPPDARGLAARTEQLRQDIVARLDSRMDLRESAIAAALMIGERGAVLDADWEAMRISGLAHMLSISGMHVGLVAALVFFVTRAMMAAVPWLALRYPVKKYAAFLALLAAAFYTVLAVPSVPSYRSLLMSGFVLLAVMADRKPFSMRTVALAALVVLLVTPEAVWSASFQMSFAATAALIFFFEETAGWWARLRREAGPVKRALVYLGGVCGTTLAAGTATMPFAIYHFQQFTSYGMLGNLLAVPVLSFVVMPMVVLAFIAIPFGAEKPVLAVMQWGIELINVISYSVAGLPHAQMVVAAWPPASLLVMCAAGIFFMLWNGRGRGIVAGGLLLLSVVLIVQSRPPDIAVSADAGLMAVRYEDGVVALSTARKDKFAAGIWMRQMGRFEDEALYWPREGAGPQEMQCDWTGCRTIVRGKKIAFSLKPEGLAEDCAWAEIVIARSPLRRMKCDAAIVIDRFDVWRSGAHIVWVDQGRVIDVAEKRGDRPWTISTGR